MFWDNIISLCASTNISPNKMCADLGLSNAIATKWKNGAMPRQTTLNKIAEYFGVEVSQLISTDIKKEKPLSYSDLTETEKIEANRLLSLTDEEMKQLWNYVDFLLSQRDK